MSRYIAKKGNTFATQVDLNTLQEQANIVITHPPNSETKGLIDAEFIKRWQRVLANQYR